MAHILIFDEDAYLWKSVCEILESAGYTVCRAHNDYEGLAPALIGFMALTKQPIQSVVIV